MAGLFGLFGGQSATQAPNSPAYNPALLGGDPSDPSRLTMRERAMAAMSALNGDMGSAMQIRQFPLMRMRQAAAMQQIGALFGGQQAQQPVMTDPGTGPTMKGPGEDSNPIGPAQTPPTYAAPSPRSASLSDPATQRALASANLWAPEQAKFAANLLEKAQPHIMVTPSGDAINDKDPSMAGRIFPKIENGQVVLRDARGNPTGVINLPGAAQAAGETAGAVTGAQEQQKASWDLVDVPMSDGSTIKLPRAIAVPILAQRAGGMAGGVPTAAAPGAPGAAMPPGVAAAIGQTQTPAAAELAKARAATQGKNETDVSGARSALQQVDDQTNMIAQNLHDMLGETQDPQTGKWVKTKSSMIGHLSTGSGTDLIEHIPFVNQSAKDLEAKIETVRNGTSFNSLQAIKNALAAAGDGGSGSIRMTDQTARMLGEINGSLNQDQSGPQFEATVRRHLEQLDALSKARHDLFQSQYQGIRPTTPGQTAPTANYNKPPASTAQAFTPAERLAEARRRGLIH